ncbi:MAG: zinc-finger domain-containing protein [Alphaproteobacteria bacterium]
MTVMPAVSDDAKGEAFEVIDVTTKRPACDGGGGALGHPRVYLNMGSQTHITCPYCSRTFRWVLGGGQDGPDH